MIKVFLLYKDCPHVFDIKFSYYLSIFYNLSKIHITNLISIGTSKNKLKDDILRERGIIHQEPSQENKQVGKDGIWVGFPIPKFIPIRQAKVKKSINIGMNVSKFYIK